MWMRTRGPEALARAVASCRQNAGMTQAQLARRLRINRTTLLDMEAGRNQAVARAAEALSVLGYDLVVVPRSAKVTVVEVPVDGSGGGPTPAVAVGSAQR